MDEQLLKTSRADFFGLSEKKLRKSSEWGGIHPLARRRVNIIFTFFKKQCYKSLAKGEPENNEI